MNVLQVLVLGVAAMVTGGATAQSTPGPEDAPVQPGLAALVQPRVAELRSAGVKQILARTGKGRRDIQVLTQWGPAYFPWPKGVTPAPFEIYLNSDGKTAAFAHGFNDATRPAFGAALDAVVPQAIRGATNARASAQRPRA